MKSLFNPVDNAELINRINQLKPELQPAWGKMNATHMLYHCQQPMRLGLGEFKMKQGFIGFLFGRTAKKKILRKKKRSSLH